MKLGTTLPIDDETPEPSQEPPTKEELEELSKCPEGVPQDVWDAFLARQADYLGDFKAGVKKHLRDLERTTLASQPEEPKVADPE